jgi:phosphoserine phosphatase
LTNPRISFFDFDGTLYKGKSRYLILDFSTYLVTKDVIEPEALTQLSSLFDSYQDNKLNRNEFGVQVVQKYYQNIGGKPAIDISDHARFFWGMQPPEAWYNFTSPLLAFTGSFSSTILISGSPLEVLQYVQTALGFEKIFASKGSILDGIYTGKVEKEMATQTAKETMMREISINPGFDPSISFAFGDSESDFPLLQQVNPENAFLLGTNDFHGIAGLNENWNFLPHDMCILDRVKDCFQAHLF